MIALFVIKAYFCYSFPIKIRCKSQTRKSVWV